MNIVELLTTFNGGLGQLTILIPTVIGFCSAVATVVPESTPYVGKIIHKIGGNFGQAANK
jgi:hypothetical protein